MNNPPTNANPSTPIWLLFRSDTPLDQKEVIHLLGAYRFRNDAYAERQKLLEARDENYQGYITYLVKETALQ
jgi:hypothetical protein